jgi:hypothetical protein
VKKKRNEAELFELLGTNKHYKRRESYEYEYLFDFKDLPQSDTMNNMEKNLNEDSNIQVFKEEQ